MADIIRGHGCSWLGHLDDSRMPKQFQSLFGELLCLTLAIGPTSLTQATDLF